MKAGELQMNLRKKRHPTSYQNEDNYTNLVGMLSLQQEYEQVTRGIARKEPPSRTNEHGNVGRLLVQFINQINYNCRQNKRSKEREKRQAFSIDERIGAEPRKKLKQDNVNDSASSQMRRGAANNDDRPEKADEKRLLKELYRFKDQQHPNLKNLLQDPKAYSKGQPAQMGQQNIADYMQMVQNLGQEYLMNAYPGLNNIQSLNALTNLNTMNLNLSLLMQNQIGQKMPAYPVADTRYTDSQKKEKTPESKLFKRAAFHVAIAYHIHLRKAKEKNRDSAEMDPTYYARKLRERNNAEIRESKKKAEEAVENNTRVEASSEVINNDQNAETTQPPTQVQAPPTEPIQVVQVELAQPTQPVAAQSTQQQQRNDAVAETIENSSS